MIQNYELLFVNNRVKALTLSEEDAPHHRITAMTRSSDGLALITADGQSFALKSPEDIPVFEEDLHLFVLKSNGETLHHFHLFFEVL